MSEEYGWIDDDQEDEYGWVDDKPKQSIGEMFSGYANSLATGAGEAVIDTIKSAGYGTEKILAGPARLATELAGSESGVQAVDDFMSSEAEKAKAVSERSPFFSAVGDAAPLVAGGAGVSLATKIPTVLSAIAGSALERGIGYDTSGDQRGDNPLGRVQDFIGDAAEGGMYGAFGYGLGKGAGALGGVGKKFLAREADALGGKNISDVMTDSYQKAIDFGKTKGIEFTPGQKLKREGSGLLEEGSKQAVKQHNQKIANKLAGESLGYEGVDSLGRKTRAKFMTKIKEELDKVDIYDFDFDKKFLIDLDDARNSYLSSVTRDDKVSIMKVINRIYEKFDTGLISGESYNAIRDGLAKDLRLG